MITTIRENLIFSIFIFGLSDKISKLLPVIDFAVKINNNNFLKKKIIIIILHDLHLTSIKACNRREEKVKKMNVSKSDFCKTFVFLITLERLLSSIVVSEGIY